MLFLIWIGLGRARRFSKVPKEEGAEAADVDIKAKKNYFPTILHPLSFIDLPYLVTAMAVVGIDLGTLHSIASTIFSVKIFG